MVYNQHKSKHEKTQQKSNEQPDAVSTITTTFANTIPNNYALRTFPGDKDHSLVTIIEPTTSLKYIRRKRNGQISTKKKQKIGRSLLFPKHPTARSNRRKWSTEEDDIVIREYNLNPKNYCVEALKYLPTRSIRAIQKRFRKVLYNHRDVVVPVVPFTALTRNNTFSAEEDAIIAQEHAKKEQLVGYKYALEASKKLYGRSESSIYNRWHSYLRNKAGPVPVANSNRIDTHTSINTLIEVMTKSK